MLSAELHRERQLWRRRPWLACDCADYCRCEHKRRPTPKRVEAYAEAVRWLDRLGAPAAPLCPELDALRRRGGASRELAEAVLRRWQK